MSCPQLLLFDMPRRPPGKVRGIFYFLVSTKLLAIDDISNHYNWKSIFVVLSEQARIVS